MASFALAQVPDEPAAYRALEGLRAADMRAATIARRLAIANVALCGRPVNDAGLLLHHERAYEAAIRPAARALFRFESPVQVEGVVAGGPAARAGIRAGDSLLAIDGRAIGDRGAPDGIVAASFAQLGAPGAGHLLRLARDGVVRDVAVAAEAACPFRAQVAVGDDLNVSTDGRTVQISTSLMNLVDDDALLASALAHELAHVVLRHPERLTAAHVARGRARERGRSRRLWLRTETEADRLSPYLLANAGYPAVAAARYWRLYGVALARGLPSSPTHPPWQERAAMLEAEAAQMPPAGSPRRPAWWSAAWRPLR